MEYFIKQALFYNRKFLKHNIMANHQKFAKGIKFKKEFIRAKRVNTLGAFLVKSI